MEIERATASLCTLPFESFLVSLLLRDAVDNADDTLPSPSPRRRRLIRSRFARDLTPTLSRVRPYALPLPLPLTVHSPRPSSRRRRRARLDLRPH